MRLPAGLALGADESSELYQYAGDVLTAFDEAALKVVTGSMDEAGYRQMIDDAMGMGLDRMTELYQNAYDEFMSRDA